MIDQMAFTVRRVEWAAAGAQLSAIRHAVFVVEQRVPEHEEWDGMDAVSRHVLACARDGAAIGTGRLLPQGASARVARIARIGRMAVLKPWRGCGVGSALLQALIALARENGFHETRLHAQTHALGFYRKHGYTPLGEAFFEAGIPHCEMRLHITPQ